MENGGQMRVEDALSTELEFPHPAEGLTEAFLGGLEQADGWVGNKLLDPVQRLDHRQERGEPPVISDYVEEFGHYQRRKDQAANALGLGLDRSDGRGIRGMIREGKLDKDVAVQTGHCRPNISSAISAWEMTGVKTRCPLSERMRSAARGLSSFLAAGTSLATGLFPWVSSTSSPA